MFEYLEKFKNLPADIKASISTPEVLKATDDLEKQYNIDLAITIMRVMVKEISLAELPIHLFTDLALNQDAVDKLTTALKEKVFAQAMTYLTTTAAAAPEIKAEPKAEAKNEGLAEQAEIKNIDNEVAVESAAPEMQLDDYSAKVYEAIDKLVEEFDISGPHLMKFKDAIKLYLRDVRSKIDTRAFMLKSVSDGGLAFTVVMIDKVISRADVLKDEIHNSFKPSAKPSFSIMDKINELNKVSADRDVAYDLSKILDLKHEIKGGLDLSHEIASPVTEVPKMEIAAPVAALSLAPAPTPAPVVPPKINPISLGAINPAALLDAEDILPPIKKEIEETPILKPIANKILDSALKTISVPVPAPISKPIITSSATPTPTVNPNPSKFTPGKIKIEDIKSIKTMSPIDELLYMDLVNFRRLGISVDEIMDKIKSRIDFMKSDDYEKGLAALTAWRRSPVNKLYLKIVGRATSEDKTIPAIIEDLKNSKQDYLSMDEIEGIITLNNRLRF